MSEISVLDVITNYIVAKNKTVFYENPDYEPSYVSTLVIDKVEQEPITEI